MIKFIGGVVLLVWAVAVTLLVAANFSVTAKNAAMIVEIHEMITLAFKQAEL